VKIHDLKLGFDNIRIYLDILSGFGFVKPY
jgi:hypothetical protein